MFDILLGFIHISIGVFTAFYAFIMPKNFLYDFLYIEYTILIFILWCIYDGCPITYYYHKYTNKIDYEAIIKTDSPLYIIGDNTLDIILLCSIYTASIRSKVLPLPLTIFYLLMKVFYNFFVKKNTLFLEFKSCTHVKVCRPYIINLFFFINILLLVYIIYKNRLKLY